MFKKILSCFLVAIMVICAVPFSVSADVAEQTPTVLENNGWIGISTAEDFLKIGVDSSYPANGNYYLQNDIDFGGKKDTANLVSATFKGSLDGRGFALYNFELVGTSGRIGVFYTIYASDADVSAGVYNLSIGKSDAPVKITVTNANNAMAGFLAGAAYMDGNDPRPAFIDGVDVYGTIEMTSNTADVTNRAGGFVGYARELIMVDCSFTGGISVVGEAKATQEVGGLVGGIEGYSGSAKDDSNNNVGTLSNNRRITFKDCTVNATTIASSNNAEGSVSYVGGIVGSTKASTYVTGCTVNGAITSDDSVGGLLGYIESKYTDYNSKNGTILVAMVDNSIVATLTGTKANGAYGTQNETGDTERIYIYNCAGAEGTKSRDIGDFSGDFDPAYNYVWIIDDAADFGKIGSSATYGDSQTYTYPTDGFYRLDGDNGVIDMGGAVRNTPVVNVDFNGVFDGNGNVLTGLAFNFGSAGAFFKNLANANDTILTNFVIGTPESLATYHNGAGSAFAGVIGNRVGSQYNTLILDNVDVYATVTSRNYAWVGGLLGESTRTSLFDCDMNGSITVKDGANRIQIGGIVGWTGNYGTIFHGCDNYATLTADLTGTNGDRCIIGGMTSAFSSYCNFYKCNNYGDINNASGGVTMHASAGIVTTGWAWNQNYKSITVVYCANFGDITATHKSTAGVALESPGNIAALVMANFENYGNVTASAGGTATNDYTTTLGASSIKHLNSTTITDEIVSTGATAAVRLSDPTGLRFTAKVSDKAIQRFGLVYGESEVSYGILIAPAKFVERANGMTHAALEKYSTEVNGFKEVQKAYLDLEVDGYFKDQTGVIAGSLVNIDPALYKTDMTAIAYVKVGDNYIYAETATTKNIYSVASAALADLGEKDSVDGEYVYNNKLEAGEKYFADGALKTVGATDELYSCYTKAQRDTLNKIVADAN